MWTELFSLVSRASEVYMNLESAVSFSRAVLEMGMCDRWGKEISNSHFCLARCSGYH